MTFLPIVRRELRVASKKRATYRTRLWFALITSLLAAGLILVESPNSGRGRGTSLFQVLTTLAFGYCLLAGIRHAADALSEEKREGTLGLLFLTDLKPYDVVAGKLASIAVRTFQGLFALFPVLATGLVLGGITPGEFWRMAGVLTSTLFIALAAGLWVSSQSRDAYRAIAGTIALLSILVILPLVTGWILPVSLFGRLGRYVSYLSPATAAGLAWDAAYRSDPSAFWFALGWSHLLGWCFLLFAGLVLPRSWQDQPVRTSSSEQVSQFSAPFLDRRRERRTRLLEINPILWLASRQERERVLITIFSITCAIGGVIVLLLSRSLGGTTLGISTVLNLGLSLVLKLWVAWQASATLAEARRTGAIELLLATPLGLEEIIRGHWQALQRIFAWPLVATLLVRTIPTLDVLINQPSAQNGWLLLSAPAMTVFSLATLILDVIALAWVGMWMGLTQPKPVQAFARTFGFVTIVPAVIFCLPNILFDLFWIQWSRGKLQREFRRAAADRFGPALPERWTVREIPRPLTAPPIITS